MTTFDNREKAFENKFALDAETRFKAESRAAKKLGLWVAEKLGLTGEAAETYAKAVVASNLEDPGFDDVIAFVEKDTNSRGLSLNRNDISGQIEAFFKAACEELKG